MEWYKTLNRTQKLGIREAFELATGQRLSDMVRLFTFSECMDILYNKLKMEGFKI